MTSNPFSQHSRLLRQHRRQGSKPFKKPPKWFYPVAIEIKYKLFLLSFVKRLEKHTKRILFNALPAIIADANMLQRVDAWGDELENVMENISVSFDNEMTDDALQSFMKAITQRANAWNTTQFHNLVNTVMGVDHYAYEPWLTAHMKSFVLENVGLVKKLKEETFQNINQIVQSGIRGGDSYRSITKEIMGTDLEPGQFSKTKDRARLIARDQIGKFNGELTSIRQKSIGVSEYYWRTASDDRVRDSHDALNGMLCKWDDSSVYSDDDGETWKSRTSEMFDGDPGDDFQCRCWAEAKFTEPVNEEETE